MLLFEPRSPTELKRSSDSGDHIENSIAGIAQKIFLRQNTFFDVSDDSSDGNDYMETGLKYTSAPKFTKQQGINRITKLMI